MPEENIVIPAEPLRQFARSILAAAGVPGSSAELVAEALVASNLRGVDSHGVQLLVWYVDQIELGSFDLNTRGSVVSENGACLVYDGENGLGQVVSEACCRHAVRLAREHGLGMVAARESNHFGAAAFWAQRIASEGMIGMAMCNATPMVAPWQGRERRFGTNPISMAVPGPKTWLLDMATTTVAFNKILKASYAGQPTIPAGWALDAGGNPTTDTQAAVNGSPMPLGGYKGYGLAMMVEILCGVLSGGEACTGLAGIRMHGGTAHVSHFFLAADAARFLPLDEFAARMKTLADSMKTSQPAAGYDEVLVAGDPEWRAAGIRSREGIPLSRGIWQNLTAIGRRLNVPIPEPGPR